MADTITITDTLVPVPNQADAPIPKKHNFTPPEYTIKEIYDAIPLHCFERSSLLSLGYVLRDFAFIGTLMYIASYIPQISSPRIMNLAWCTYSFCQGIVFTGLWELGHESGHGALSTKKWVNNAFGMVIHSFLLVPFHSWRITHATHHKSTNNMATDIAFVPDTQEAFEAIRQGRRETWLSEAFEMFQDTPIAALLFLAGHQVIAWPTYLIINNFALPRMAAMPWWKRSHFYFGGDGPNFKPQHKRDIIISDLGIAFTIFLLTMSCKIFGSWNVMLFYGFPFLWTNNWILIITFLQHTDLNLPYYAPESWTWLRGSASGVDRSVGWLVGTFLWHGATETHVLHHHVSRIPFYHAHEASAAIEKVMGTHYQSDRETNYVWAFWKNFRQCRFVNEIDPGTGIYFFDKEI